MYERFEKIETFYIKMACGLSCGNLHIQKGFEGEWSHLHIFFYIDNFCDFLLAFQERAFSNLGLHLKKKNCSYRSKSFPLKIDPN